SKAAPKAAPAGNSAESLSIGKLRLEDGQITLGNTNSRKRTVYTKVNLTASDVAMKNNFPVLFSMELPGGGSMKIDGKIGPVDAEDAALTPQNVKLTISGLNLSSTGFLDPSLGLGGVADMDANLVSEKGQMATKGQLKLSKAVLVAGGSPAGVPAVINFDTKYDLVKGTGILHPSTLSIGNAKSNLSGTYKSEGDDFTVDVKITGEGLPATDLESFLPALGINLPDKSRLSAGTMNTNLHVSGPTDNLDAVVPAFGSMVGNGTVDAKNNLDFKLVATVNNTVATAAAGSMAGGLGGTVGKMLGGGATACKNGGIQGPLQIQGTTANPQFV